GDADRVEGGGIGGGRRRLLRIGLGWRGVPRERRRRQGGHRGHREGDGGRQRGPVGSVWQQLHHLPPSPKYGWTMHVRVVWLDSKKKPGRRARKVSRWWQRGDQIPNH